MKRLLISLSLLAGVLVSCNNDDEPSITTKTEVSYPISEMICGIPTPSDTYVYPFYRGTEEWSKESDRVGYDKMMEYCIIPEEALKSMSTAGLIRSLLDNPDILLISASNNENTYPHYIAWTGKTAISGILKELYTRDDAAKEAISMYKAFNPAAQWIWEVVDIPDMHVKLVNLLNDASIFNQLDFSQKKEVASIAIEKMEICGKRQIRYWAHEDMLLGKIMLSEAYSPMQEFYKKAEVKECVDEGAYLHSLRDKMVGLAKDFIKGK